MPAGTAWAVMPAGRRPGRLAAGFDGFHSTKSIGVALVGRDIDARAGQHLVERAAGER